MRLLQMPINPHRQSATILMPQPTTDCRNIHGGLYAGCREEVPEIVMGEIWEAKAFAGRLEAPLGAVDLVHEVLGLGLAKRRFAGLRSFVSDAPRNGLSGGLSHASSLAV